MKSCYQKSMILVLTFSIIAAAGCEHGLAINFYTTFAFTLYRNK